MTAKKKKPSATAHLPSMSVDIMNCPRCGLVHWGEILHKLHQPMLYGKAKWTHWAMCPNLFEPVMLGDVEVKK